VTVKKSPPASKPKTPAKPTVDKAWQEVLARVSDLGDAMKEWAKVAGHEADTKQKLDQVRADIDDMARKADAALGHAGSEAGQYVGESAEQASRAFSDAARRVRKATEPHVRDAFAELSDAFGKAAGKMGEPKPKPAPSKKAATPRAKPKAGPKKK
jgi:ElaB/YqjD/DUF883 family membrane-anchored ribosome-binding protein